MTSRRKRRSRRVAPEDAEDPRDPAADAGPILPVALRGAFARGRAFRRLPDPEPGRVIAAGGLCGSAKALLVAALRERGDDVFLVCCADDVEVAEWIEDLLLFSPARPGRAEPVSLPELDLDEDLRPVVSSLRARGGVLVDLEPRSVLLATMSALMAPVAAAETLADRVRVDLRPGMTRDPTALLAEALEAGMRRVPQVVHTGEISLRGDVLDVFPEGGAAPLRIEFFDDEIESIRHFDPEDQGSTEHVGEATLVFAPAGDAVTAAPEEPPFPLDLLAPGRSVVVVVEPVRFEERLSRFTLREGSLARPVAAFQEGLRRLRSYSLSALPAGRGHDFGTAPLQLGAIEGWDLKGRILAASRLTERPLVVLRSEPEVARLTRLARTTAGGGDPGIDATTGHLARGFRLPELGRCILNHGEFFGTGVARRRPAGRKRARVASRVLDSLFELESGDLVVHAVHGIARFAGIERGSRGVAGGDEDHLRLAFQDDVEVLVPASKIDLVQKYVGAGQTRPKLDKLGGRSFSRRKAQVARALRDMASDLLELQIARRRTPGFACPREDELYDEFERSFPYEDTADQAKATREITADQCAARPMDRLLCGDVGFGKTELAMRAAFRVVSAGRQVAVLVPTTLLADQHGRTFRERFGPFPVRVEVLSRLQTAKQKREIVEATGRGRVDVLIGTHRLLGEDVAFPDLGLLVIDEEQRFGVAHKERIRHLRAHVDVLTMTATPIPRTLHMSLLGIKDISSLATPPPGRLAIETQVVHRRAAVIRDAILREVARGGQVFFLHNRVLDIDVVRRELEELVPEARFTVGHGQMSERELLHNMQRFLSGRADVLLSTTIVESGIDIPRANTILVDNAHAFGLADLHQLRGRVGRDLDRARCLLLVDDLHPITNEARRRLQAMERFSELGAGFQIAMRDLEIRGAGNLLGPEQSGHIAAIGYDLYCKLLHAAVERARSPEMEREEPPVAAVADTVDVDIGVEAYLPRSLARDERMRLALLREMDRAGDERSHAAIRTSLRDRFGRLPIQVDNLLALFLVKHQLAARGMRAARWMPPDQVILAHEAGRGPQGRWLDAFADVRPIRPDRTCVVLPPPEGGTAWTPETVLARLVDSLLERGRGRKLAGRPSGSRA